MPNNIVFSNPGGSVIRWGNGAATPYLTLSGLPSTGTVGVAVSGLVTNPSAATATWTVSSSPADAIVTPSSGTLAPGVAVAFTLTALASGLKNVQLTSTTPNTIISGSPHSFTAASVAPPPPPPAPAASALTLSMASTGTTGSATLVTVTPNAAIGATGTATLSVSGGGTLGTSTLNFTAGSSAAQSTTLTRTTDGLSTVTLTNNMGLTNSGTPANFISSTPPVVSSTGGTPGFSLTSTTGATLAPFTIGMALIEGQFPGSIGVSGVASGQAIVRNTWPDGSAKFAVISGRATVTAGTSTTATLTRNGATGTALTEADLTATGVTATLQFGGGLTMSLASLIGVSAAGAVSGVITGGRAKQIISGPTMSSWLYCAPLSASNPHIIGWMEVRLYVGGHVHVLPWVENGWTRVTGPASVVGNLTFTLGGTTRFTQTDVHLCHHGRVVAQDVAGAGYWLGTAPDLYAAPDPEYIQSTGLVPTYFADTSGATTRLNALSQVYSPANYGQLLSSPRDSGGNGTNNGDFDAGMANAGYHAGIGPLPEWDAFYLTSGADVRAWKAVVANAMGYGRYAVHQRDELTLAPVNPADVPLKTLGTGFNIADRGANQFGATETLPNATAYDPSGVNLQPEYWAQTHHPSGGFMAYLLTGQEFFLELSQFIASTCFLRQNNLHRDYGNGYQRGYYETTRGAAWALRSIFQAATISVDGSALQTGLSAIVAANISDYTAKYITVPIGSYGATRPYSNFNSNPAIPMYRVNAWEYDFSVAAWGYGLKMKPPVGTTPLANMRTFFQWHGQFPVHRLGALGNADTYGFNAAARENSFPIAPSYTTAPWDTNTGWYNTPGEVFQDAHSASNSTNTTNTIGAFDANNGYFPDATSYWGNMMAALSYAVDHGVSGALDGYERMVAASNWLLFETDARTKPVGAIRPSSIMAWGAGSATGSVVGDVWTPGKDAAGRVNKESWAIVPTGRWIEVAGTRIDTQLTTSIVNAGLGWTSATLWGTTGGNSIFQSWSGFVTDSDRARLWFIGGGHSDGFNNGLYRFDGNKMAWSIECLPSSRSLMSTTYLNGGSSTNHPDATATAVANFNANTTAGQTTGTIVPATNGPFYDEIPTDGKPTARHSYQGLAYAPTVGAAGSLFMHARRLWRYDIASGQWVFKRLINDQARSWPAIAAPNATGVIEIHAAEAALAVWDEVNNKVLMSASGSAGGGAYQYNWTTQAWSSWGASYAINYNDAAHVRVGRTMVAFKPPVTDQPVYVGRYWQHDLDAGTTTAADVQFGGGLSLSDFVSGSAFYDGAAITYVPTLNRYWCCTRNTSGGMQWIQLDPTTTPWTASPLTFSNGNNVSERLILGRVQWLEGLQAVLLWDHCFVNAKIYKV